MRPTDVPVIRHARAGDEEGIARVHVDSWRETYAGIVPAEYLASLSYESRRAMWERLLGSNAAHQVAFIADAPGAGTVGFASGYLPPDANSPRIGRLMTLYVLRAWQANGIGRALFAAVVDGLRELGAERLALWVVAANPSRGFYERMGGRAGQTRRESIGGSEIEEVEYVWNLLPTMDTTAL